MLIGHFGKKEKKRKEKAINDWRMDKCNNICSNRCDFNSHIYNPTFTIPTSSMEKSMLIGDYYHKQIKLWP